MALTYRSPMEDIVASFDPAVQSAIASTAANTYKDMEERNHGISNYHIPAGAKMKLSNAGIYLSPFSGVVHSHPVCKTLENYFLYTVLPTYVNNKFFFIGIKNGKLNILKQRTKGLDLVQAINRYVTSADKARYSNDFVTRSTLASGHLKRHSVSFESDTLRTLVPEIARVSGKHFFLHDELHYWGKNELIAFLEVFKPEMLLGTIVFPPELLVGAKRSLNPWCYEFDVCAKDLLFYPDGVRSEAYQQPVSGGYLLSTRYIRLPDSTIYSVDILCSKFAHHLVSITKGELANSSFRSFGPFEATAVGRLDSLYSVREPFIPVSFDLVSRLYRYLRSLKKPDSQSAMAKLSQIVAEPTAAEIKFTQDFAQLVIGADSITSMLCSQTFKRAFGRCISGALPGWLAQRFDTVREVCLDDFISEMRPYYITRKLKDISLASELEDLLTTQGQIEGDFDPIRAMDDSFVGPSSKQAMLTLRSPYAVECHQGKAIREFIAISTETAIRGFARVLLASFIDPTCEQISYAALEGMLQQVLFRGYLLIGGLTEAFGSLSIFKAKLHSRINAILRSRHLYCFAKGEYTWFSMRKRRFNCLFLQGCTEGPTHFRSFMSPWSAVVGEITGAGSLTRTFWSGTETIAETRVEPDSPTISEAAEIVKGLREDLANLLGITSGDSITVDDNGVGGWSDKCRCGVELARTYRHYTKHSFIAPDRLRNRSCGWYSVGSVPYSYTGASHTSIGWPEWLTTWMSDNGVPEKFNCCLYQVYDAGSGVKAHADDEEIFIEGGEILTINLFGEATFGFGCIVGAVEVPFLAGQSLLMPSGFQGDHKHWVNGASEGRASVTFRTMRGSVASPQKSPSTVQLSEREDDVERSQESELGAKNTRQQSGTTTSTSEPAPVLPGNRFFSQNFDFGNVTRGFLCNNWLDVFQGNQIILNERVVVKLKGIDFPNDPQTIIDIKDLTKSLCDIGKATSHTVCFFDFKQEEIIYLTGAEGSPVVLIGSDGRSVFPVYPPNFCVPEGIAQALNRGVCDILGILLRDWSLDNFGRLLAGLGVDLSEFSIIFDIFSVEAKIIKGSEVLLFGEGGRVKACFELQNEHLVFLPHLKNQGSNLQRVVPTDLSISDACKLEIYQSSSEVIFTVSETRATMLASSLHEGGTGIMSSQLFNNKADLKELMWKNIDIAIGSTRKFHMIVGTFGCGKSTLIKKIFRKALGKKMHFVSPRRKLLEGIKTDLLQPTDSGHRGGNRKRPAGTSNWNFCTFELFLQQAIFTCQGQAIFFDEFQLYPPGYFDLVCALLPDDVHIVLMGDPCQSDYDSEGDRAFLGLLPGNPELILGSKNYNYKIQSHRFLNPMFSGRLPCEMTFNADREPEGYLMMEGFDSISRVPEEMREVFLVSSFDEKKIVNSYITGVEVQTFGESTGLTFQRGTIIITMISERTSDKRWLTALSRFRENLCLINSTGLSWDSLLLVYKERALGKFLCGRANVKDLNKYLPGSPNFSIDFPSSSIGRDEGLREEKLAGDPWLKTMVDLGQAEDFQEIIEAEEAFQDVDFKTHIPREELSCVRARWIHRILAKEAREVRMGTIVSEQFCDDYSKQVGGERLTNAAERFETIYPRHRAGDKVTFLMAVKKRLRFSKPAIEKAKLYHAKNYGKFLLDEFIKKVPLKRQHDKVMMDQAREDFFDKKTSKSAATIENHSERSCRDWLADVGMIFSKSQLCTKFDNRFRNAKAAQSIVCFQHAVLCRFAPYMRYIEMKVKEVLPDRYYIHSGKGLDELNKWVIAQKFEGICTESDYEAFDASQDEYLVAFEIAVMRYLGLPNDLIHDYEYIKTHLGSKLGNFAIMRFSGEASTFLFNTMANMLFTFLRYEIHGDESICFAGDDMCANKKLRKVDTHASFLDRLKLKAKVQFTNKPTFCGWHLCIDGIYKKPQLVLERMCIARELNNLHNCIDNYAIEVGYAYKHGELFIGRMDEEETGAYYNCVRTIVKNKHLLKSDVKNLYENCVL